MSLTGALDIPTRPNTGLQLDIAVTPGGTMFSVTPGGTRIVYKKADLLKMRDSPLSKTPPAEMQLPFIPGITIFRGNEPQIENIKLSSSPPKSPLEEQQFFMDV